MSINWVLLAMIWECVVGRCERVYFSRIVFIVHRSGCSCVSRGARELKVLRMWSESRVTVRLSQIGRNADSVLQVYLLDDGPDVALDCSKH